MYAPWTTFLRLLICLNENEKRLWCLIYFVCEYSEEDCSSRGKLTHVIKHAAVCRITGLALPSLTREVRTTEDSSLKFAYLVLRNTRRPNVKSPDYLPNLLCIFRTRWKRRQQQVWGKKSSWDILFQVISVEKQLLFHITNCCLGCVGYVFVGLIYQNMGERDPFRVGACLFWWFQISTLASRNCLPCL